jgi:hypothetical protein
MPGYKKAPDIAKAQRSSASPVKWYLPFTVDIEIGGGKTTPGEIFGPAASDLVFGGSRFSGT